MPLGCIADYGMSMKWLTDHESTIDHLADVDKEYKFCCAHFTALDMAVIAKRRDLVDKLIRRGAKTSNLEFMMLHTGWSFDDIVALCYQSGEKPGFAIMSNAVRQGNADRLEWLLDKGGDVNAVGGEVSGFDDRSLLDRALLYGNNKIVALLLHRGASLSAHSLDCAIRRREGAVQMVELLVRRGASISPDSLRFALARSEEGAVDITRFLLKHGADVNAPIRWGSNLLWVSFGGNDQGKEREAHIALLLEFGANPNVATDEGATPLMFAAARGELTTINLLLQHGADWTLRNKDGLTAVDFAEKRNQHKAVAILLAKATGHSAV